MGGYLEIWSPDRWEKFCQEKLPDFEKVAAKHLDGLFSGLAAADGGGEERERGAGADL